MTLANIVCFMKISSCFKVENFEAGITDTMVCKWAGKFNPSSVQNVLIASKIPNYYNFINIVILQMMGQRDHWFQLKYNPV